MTDRSLPATGGLLAMRPNGHNPDSQSTLNRRLSRKSLGNTDAQDNIITSDADGDLRHVPRPTYTSFSGHRQGDSLFENRISNPSPGGRAERSTTPFEDIQSRNTRIPRPATVVPAADSHQKDITRSQTSLLGRSTGQPSPMRQPMSLRAAFKRAQEQERAAAGGATDWDTTMDLQRAFNMANDEFDAIRGVDGSPSPAPRPRRGPGASVPPKKMAGIKPSDPSAHLEQFDRDHGLVGDVGPLKGLFTGTSAGLAKTTGGGGRGGVTERHSTGVQHTGLENQEKTTAPVMSSRETQMVRTSGGMGADIPVPSIEDGYASDEPFSPYPHSNNVSPDKSMNWNLDADFTAGDIQISASPRIATGKHNFDSGRPPKSPAAHPGNTRLNQIRQQEVEAAGTMFPESPRVSKPTNHKMDRIRALEMEASSKRALASSRLDEIKLKNSEPRSRSPETRKDQYKNLFEENLSTHPDPLGRLAPKSSSNSEPRGEPIRDTPIVVFKNPSATISSDGGRDQSREHTDKRGALARSDSHDLLRRLARATSASPREESREPEQAKTANIGDRVNINKPLSPTHNLNRSFLPSRVGGLRNLEIKNPKDRPTVGFADLIRPPPGSSNEVKGTSRPASEANPTDRISAELDLFAPQDNYSEKGSVRAPSPIPSEPAEETPRPPRIDPLTQPTPRVSGAYIDTPATVRVKASGEHVRNDKNESAGPQQVPTAQTQSSGVSPTKRVTRQDAIGQTKPLKPSGLRSSSLPTKPGRSRSSSRRRRPLINTARPPTVREDIISILRAHDIDDSTLENLDSILADNEVDDQAIKQMVGDTVLKFEDDLKIGLPGTSDPEQELAAYDRMSKSLQTGLLGIRSAKKGIERLEDKVNQHGDKDGHRPKSGSGSEHTQKPPTEKGEAASFRFPVPRLYRRSPKFKLTTLGIVAICALMWYALESAFCSLYEGPEYICTADVPCDWSPNEPYFPYTMPFMLDEWATGGMGRALAIQVSQEVGDVYADVSDWVANKDISQEDEQRMDIWQRKRHRRRLRKHALAKRWIGSQDYEARFREWKQTLWGASEVAQDSDIDDEDTLSADEIM